MPYTYKEKDYRNRYNIDIGIRYNVMWNLLMGNWKYEEGEPLNIYKNH